jgi:hypothetical protein
MPAHPHVEAIPLKSARLISLAPLFGVCAALLQRVAPAIGQGLAVQFILFGVVYPCLAGLDPARQPLYLNLCALGLLVFMARLVAERVGGQGAGTAAAGGDDGGLGRLTTKEQSNKVQADRRCSSGGSVRHPCLT